jgi:hypothetical protein
MHAFAMSRHEVLMTRAAARSSASEQFANRNRITLVNSAELKQLIKEHLNRDVIPGRSPPRRLRASDNTQTGRRGLADPAPDTQQ